MSAATERDPRPTLSTSTLTRPPSSVRVRIFTRRCLDPQQRLACYADGNVAVRACPGSGKTRLMAARLANELLRWRVGTGGIATMTYTNVAADEVRDALRNYMGLEVEYPHFLGTIDSFMDKQVFLPHAHRLIGKKEGGEVRLLTGDSSWARGAYPVWPAYGHGPGAASADSAQKSRGPEYNAVDAFRLPDGTCVLKSRIPGRQSTCEKCRTRADKAPRPVRDHNCGKLKMAFDGFATHDDAMFWSLEILRRWNDVLGRLAQRFSVILVDELQDTKPTQLEVLKLLRDTGNCRFFVAFDPDQAIYEYARAHPRNCRDFAVQFRNLELTCTFRSSQEVCKAAHPFSTLLLPARSRAPHGEERDSCFLLRYEDVDSAVRRFSGLVRDKGLNPQKCAVLVRKSENIEEVRSVVKRGKLTGAGALARMLLGCYALLARGSRSAAHQMLTDTLVGYRITQSPTSRDVTARREAKRDMDGRCGELLDRLPRTDLPFGGWMREARNLLTEVFPEAAARHRSLTGLLGRPRSVDPDTPVCDLLPESQCASCDPDLPISSVHGVKGRNLQGVLLLTMMKTRYDSGWLDAAKGDDGFWPEETRIAYVAMTRAERLLVLAIPAKAPASVIKHPKLAGFVHLA